ncbi:MAG: PAS domain-containing protein [Methylobacterium sp.]|uniref:PAS domain-containing protein n=1 Tax=Methylobacterium sp. TaxID=409 RepID=UPI0025D1EFA4|nr:PAS domain-containing protein [Methylobacterium sp.]MBX9931603.1 PAS domain-containing protein [Methylobacterium sp.]
MYDLFPVAANEAERLAALRDLAIVGTEAEAHFDAVCRTAAALFDLPIALISLIEEDHQWFKARCGLAVDRTSRDLAFCNHAVLSDAVMVVEDAREDPRFAHNALVTGAPHIRFYAGAPLVIEAGIRIGSLCVIDIEPRRFSADQCRQLEDLAKVVVAHLRLHTANLRQQRQNAERTAREDVINAQASTLRERDKALTETNRLLLMAEQLAQIGHWRLEVPDGHRTWSAEMFRIFGLDPACEVPRPEEAIHYYRSVDRPRIEALFAAAVADRTDFSFETTLFRPGGEARAVIVRGTYEGMKNDRATFAGVIMDVTDLKSVEYRLRESEGRFHHLSDNSTDMITQLDLEGRRIYVSPASTDLLGYAPAELLGMRPLDNMHPDDVPAFRALVEQLLAGDESRAVSVNRLRHRDGRWIWIEASIHVLRDSSGQPEGLLSSVRDTTERRRAEEALRESETRYRILADTLPQIVWIMDREDRATIYANGRFEAYHGVIGASLQERMTRYHPDDLPVIMRAWNDGIVARGGWEADIRLLRHDGVFRWHKLMIVPIHLGGEVASWLGTALDIHDLVTAREALLRSSDLLRIATEAAGAGTWDIHLALGNGIVLSPESAAMHGLDGSAPVALAAEDWNALIHPEDIGRIWVEVDRSLKARETYSAEFRVRLPDGGVRWVHGIGRAYYDPHGQPVRMIGLNFDIGNRKRVEEALIKAGQAAESARLEAEKASAAKTDFLAAMSHEIRTPLNSILGYTEMLLEAPDRGPEDRSKLTRILGSGRALLTIVNDVLDFSKIEAGGVELEPETFGLDGLVADTMSMISGLVQDKPLALQTAIDPALPQGLVGDQNRLRQVLLNLLNNAVKFTHAGEVTLSLRCLERRGDRVQLRCEVTDTGIGIPEDKRDRLFQRFSQVDGSISRRFGGTGLGLAISKSLVELMGGTIGVESRSGLGSTFWFTVELGIGEVMPALEADSGSAAMPPHAARILLVEDVAMNQEIAKAILAGAGHHVVLATDGAEAIHAVQRAAYDIVLMDVQMPVMDGLEATARIRALGGTLAEIPIIALTANVLGEQIAAFRAAGMVDHIGKPFRKADLLSAVARWVPAPSVDASLASEGPAAFDQDTIDDLIDLLGREKLARMLADLERHLASGFVLDPETQRAIVTCDADLAGSAHKLVSSAGMLGFSPLSGACRTFEGILHTGASTPAEVETVAQESLLALQALAVLRRSLVASAENAAMLERLGS